MKYKYKNIELDLLELNNNKTQNIVLVHGFSSDFYHFKPLFPLLSKYYNLYAINMPFHGESSGSQELNQFTKFPEILTDFIKAKDIKNITLIGHSMGGAIIMMAYPKLKSIIKKIILIGPQNRSSLAVEKEFHEVFFPVNVIDYEKLAKLIYYDANIVLKNKEYMKNIDHYYKTQKIRLSYIYALGRTLPWEIHMNLIDKGIKQLSVPLLLVCGEGDGIIDINNIEKYYKSLSDQIKYHKILKAGHSPWIEQFEQTTNVIEQFIKKFNR